MHKNLLLFVIVLSTFCNACQNTSTQVDATMKAPGQSIEDRLMDVNKKMIAKEAKEIDSFIVNKKWQVKTTGTGLRYYKYVESTTSLAAQLKDTVIINFAISLLNGDSIFKTKQNFHMVLGHSDQSNGLEEGLLNMRVGEKAYLIMPAHLAYGVSGDMEYGIPPNSSLLYNVQLIQIKPFNNKKNKQ